jgi:hypothetical protein
MPYFAAIRSTSTGLCHAVRDAVFLRRWQAERLSARVGDAVTMPVTFRIDNIERRFPQETLQVWLYDHKRQGMIATATSGTCHLAARPVFAHPGLDTEAFGIAVPDEAGKVHLLDLAFADKEAAACTFLPFTGHPIEAQDWIRDMFQCREACGESAPTVVPIHFVGVVTDEEGHTWCSAPQRTSVKALEAAALRLTWVEPSWVPLDVHSTRADGGYERVRLQRMPVDPDLM